MPADKPLMIDLYAGLGGWAQGGLAEGYDVIGFDVERHDYGTGVYPAQLVLQDVLTLHGSQFKDAALIVCSPPCQEFSYMAMPWSKGKKIEQEYLSGVRDKAKLTALFDACFRIQREAVEAAGHHIPIVIENVRGAQMWVGRARWNYGSYYLWGDVPALMPMTKSFKSQGMNWSDRSKHGQDFTRIAGKQAEGRKSRIPAVGKRFDERIASTPEEAHALHYRMPMTASAEGVKIGTGPDKRKGARDTEHLTNPGEWGIKNSGDWFDSVRPSLQRRASSGSSARKAASAAIAKIPFDLAIYIARHWKPK